MLFGIGLGEVLHVAPHEDQAPGASLAIGGGNAGLGAPDLAFEGVLPEALVETSRVRLKSLGRGFLALVFMIGTLAGLAGGFLALLAIRLAGGADPSRVRFAASCPMTAPRQSGKRRCL